jgi:hypothetical protein
VSNDSEVTATTTSLADSPGRSPMERSRLTTLACSSCTPLGRPVEPEV